VNWLADLKGWSGWGEANAASRGVDAPLATSFQGLSVQWDGVVTDGVAAAPAGWGDRVRGCDFERVSRPLLEGSMVIIINYNSTSINCTSVVSSRLLEPAEAAVREGPRGAGGNYVNKLTKYPPKPWVRKDYNAKRFGALTCRNK
jgi:hypothetical protein